MSTITNRSRRLYNVDLAPTPTKDKQWGWFEIFNVWANDVQSLFGYTLAASLFLTYGLNGWAVFLAIILAGFFIMWLVNLSGKPSVKHGIPYPVFARVSMGVYGANFPAMVRGIVAMFWYGAQTYFASTAVALLITGVTKINEIHSIPFIPKRIASPPSDPDKPLSKSATAVDAKYVCAPYQNIATIPLTIAGKFAPMTPILARANTG